MKTCRKCRQEKSILQFWKNKKSADGLAYYCKDCQREAVFRSINEANTKSHVEDIERVKTMQRCPQCDALVWASDAEEHAKHDLPKRSWHFMSSLCAAEW